MKKLVILATCVAAMALGSSANAVTYFGENTNPGQAVSGAPLTAHNTFLAQLTGVSVEDFEGFAAGPAPASLSFTGSAGAINAAFSGSSGQICATPSCGGSTRFATSGSHYFDVSSTITAAFSTPIAAFGFYGTDVGDISGQLSLVLHHATGPDTVIVIPHTVGAPDGSLLFFGVIDTANPFISVSFLNSQAGNDFFGFDDMIVGDVQQVTGGVPEPTTWAMMVGGLALAGAAMRRRKVSVSFA